MQPVARTGAPEASPLALSHPEEKKSAIEFATLEIAIDASKDTEEKQIHADRLRQSQIETKLLEEINGANAALCKNVTDKLLLHAFTIKLYGIAAAQADLALRPVMETKEEKVMLEHTSSTIAALFEQPAFAQIMQPLQQQLGFTTTLEMASAYLAPFIKVHIAKIKEISPEHVTGLCRVYDENESKVVLQKVAGCLAIIMAEKPSHDEYQALREVLDAQDKKACLQEKKLSAALTALLKELLDMPACSDHALATLREEVQKQLTAS